MSPRSRTRKQKPRPSAARRAPLPPRTVTDVVATAVATQPPASVRSAAATGSDTGRVRLLITSFNCETLRDFDPQGMGMTYCFDASRWEQPSRVSVRFDGRLLDPPAADQATGTFTVTEAVDVPAHAGAVTLTARAPRLTPGRWQATATASVETVGADRRPAQVWRLPAATAQGTTGFEPVMRVRAPGARLGVWPALVLTGALLAFASQLLVAPRLHVAAWPLVAVSVVASLVGLVTSKVYHKVLHPNETGGLAVTGLGIQGFVLGAISVLLAGSVIAGLPVLRALDAITPGLLLGMAIGRLGCFFGGCCAGRPTGGRGLWSSDRRLGIRRIPVQLFESAVAATVFAGALVADLLHAAPAGTVFVGALAAYVLGRQILFPLRDIPRQTRHGRPLMITVAVLVLVADIAVGLTA